MKPFPAKLYVLRKAAESGQEDTFTFHESEVTVGAPVDGVAEMATYTLDKVEDVQRVITLSKKAKP